MNPTLLVILLFGLPPVLLAVTIAGFYKLLSIHRLWEITQSEKSQELEQPKSIIQRLLADSGVTETPKSLQGAAGFQVYYREHNRRLFLVMEDQHERLTGIELEPTMNQKFHRPTPGLDQFSKLYRLTTTDPLQGAFFHLHVRTLLAALSTFAIYKNRLMLSLEPWNDPEANFLELKRSFERNFSQMQQLAAAFAQPQRPLSRLPATALFDPFLEARFDAAERVVSFIRGSIPPETDQSLEKRLHLLADHLQVNLPTTPPHRVERLRLFNQIVLPMLQQLSQDYPQQTGGSAFHFPPLNQRLTSLNAAADALNTKALPAPTHAFFLLAAVCFPEYLSTQEQTALLTEADTDSSSLTLELLKAMPQKQCADAVLIALNNPHIRGLVLYHIVMPNESLCPLLVTHCLQLDPNSLNRTLSFLIQENYQGVAYLVRKLIPQITQSEAGGSQQEALVQQCLTVLATHGTLDDLVLIRQCRPFCKTPTAQAVYQQTWNAVEAKAGIDLSGMVSLSQITAPDGALSRTENQGSLSRATPPLS